jgi:enoyl-CoA hydratase/carnithine racemase
MSRDGVIFEVKEDIGIIQLNNPERANALSKFVVNDLSNKIKELANDRNLSAVIITGGKSKAFCAGADLKERQIMDEKEIISYVELLGKTFNDIANLPMPTIAAIKGLALGGGCELALACDIRVMEEDALIGLTEVSWGIIPGAGGTQRLGQLVGLGKAKELIFTAAKLNGKQAYEIHLVEHVCEKNQAEMKALQIAEEISKNSSNSVRLSKQAIHSFARNQLKEGLRAEWEYYKQTISHPDRLEGLAAFKEKRQPNFKRKNPVSSS